MFGRAIKGLGVATCSRCFLLITAPQTTGAFGGSHRRHRTSRNSRLLHCGGANSAESGQRRRLFYMSLGPVDGWRNGWETGGCAFFSYVSGCVW